MLAYLLQGLGYGWAAAAQPGPFQAYLLSQTLRNGWRRTVWAALAPLLSDGPIVLLMVLLLTQTPDWFLTLLRLGGGVFLLYLAWGAWRASQTTVVDQPSLTVPEQGIFKAALINALSPGPYIFWATVAGPILLEGWRRSPAFGITFILGFYGTLIGGFVGFVTLFAIAGRLDRRFSRALGLTSVALLAGFGIYQLTLGFITLVPVFNAP